VRRSAKRLRPKHGKYAPVILDILQDFLLAKNWNRYSEVSLGEFTHGVYEILKKHIHLMPGFLQERLPLMIADDWLVRYGTEDGLRFTFSRVKLRSSSPELFENAVDSMNAHFEHLEADFNAFFPDAIRAVQDWHLRSE
jgi:acyl carrier protein phosphodiesterase